MSIVNLVKSIQAGETYIYNDSPKRTANMINHCFPDDPCKCAANLKGKFYGGNFEHRTWDYCGEFEPSIKASEIINHVNPLIFVQLPQNY